MSEQVDEDVEGRDSYKPCPRSLEPCSLVN